MRRLACCLVLAIWTGPIAWAAKESEYETIHAATYARHTGEPLTADVYVPKAEGPFPGVLVVHGGAWMTGGRTQLAGVAIALAKRGYTAVAINYRLAPKHPFPAQIEDCKAAVRWMRRQSPRYKIDPERIGGYGYSAGGHLVALLGTSEGAAGLQRSDASGDRPRATLQAVVAGGAPSDFRHLPPDSRMLAYWLGGTRGEMPALYRRASPAHFITADDPPMFFFYGERDRFSLLLRTEKTQRALQEAGVDVQTHMVEGKGHAAAMMDERAVSRAFEFLDRKLKQTGSARPGKGSAAGGS